MKKIQNSLLAIFTGAILLTSCKKDEDITFQDTFIEFDAATYNGRAAGLPFPILTRNPLVPGRAIIATATTTPVTLIPIPADPILTRTSTTANDTIRLRVNLVGAQRSTAETFAVKVNSTFSTAVEGAFGTPGAHFDLIDETVTIPAGSSYGTVRWVVRNPGFSSTLNPLVVFQLVGNSNIKASENFQFIGFSISQP
jgi:hypothetical protein